MGYFLHNTPIHVSYGTHGKWNIMLFRQRMKCNNDIKVMGKWLDDSDTDAITFYINYLDYKS